MAAGCRRSAGSSGSSAIEAIYHDAGFPKGAYQNVLATNDLPGPPNEDGTPAAPTSSFHSIFAFGENTVNRLREVPKGTLMYVEGDFRVVRTPSDEQTPPQEQWLVQHRNYRVLMRPRNTE